MAHTHGTLLAAVNIGLAASFANADAALFGGLSRAAKLLRWAAILMPLGFLLGGVFAMGADPGFPIVLVPVGGVMLFAGRAVRGAGREHQGVDVRIVPVARSARGSSRGARARVGYARAVT